MDEYFGRWAKYDYTYLSISIYGVASCEQIYGYETVKVIVYLHKSESDIEASSRIHRHQSNASVRF